MIVSGEESKRGNDEEAYSRVIVSSHVAKDAMRNVFRCFLTTSS